MEATLNLTKDPLIQILEKALQIPGVKVDRRVFLAQAFSKYPEEQHAKILRTDPVTAGCSRHDLHKIAMSVLSKRTLVSTGVSLATGLPGGLAMAATIPADTLQFFGMALRLAQEIGYIYGAENLYTDGKLDDKKIQGQLIVYFGVMFGVSGAAATLKLLSAAVSKTVLTRIPQKKVAEIFGLTMVKQLAKKVLNKTVSKEMFAKSVSKAIPVVGGVISGGITFSTMQPMGRRLINALEDAHFDYTLADAEKDIELLTRRNDNTIQEDTIDEELDESVIIDISELSTRSAETKQPDDASVADELLKHSKLFDAGIISSEEFSEIKKKLIDSI